MSSDSSSSRGASPSPPPVKKSSSGKKRKAEQPEIEVDLALPEPPSKKAKRLLKKGKPLPPKQDSDDDDDEPAAKKDKDEDKKAAAKKERSPYGVWIGNVRFTVTPNELRQWLVDNSGGSITPELITRVRLPSSKPKGKDKRATDDSQQQQQQQSFENKGFAYVDFATYDANVAAIALSETEWYRRKLLIKDATNFEGRPKKEKPAEGGGDDGGDNKKKAEEEEASANKSRKIFVGNLGFEATEDDVRELFAPCGEIEWAKVATFEDSGKCKGYGWVKFADAAAADWAVKGFVKIKEVEETEEDFMDVDDDAESKKEEEDEGEDSSSSSESGSDSNSDDSDASDASDASEKRPKKPIKKPTKAPVPEKKVKMRKWWVNTLHGRRLKIEHAEDDQTRYKKRYGKGAPQRDGKGAPQREKKFDGASRGKPQQQTRPRHNNNNNNQKWKSRDDGSRQDDGKQAASKEPNFHTDVSVARLTGALVKPEGKKTTFD